jgi:hypothetical protein
MKIRSPTTTPLPPRRVALWEVLRRGLRRVGEFQSALLLSLFYLVCWVPVGLMSRVAADWLHRRMPERSNWWPRDRRMNQPAHVKEPF